MPKLTPAGVLSGLYIWKQPLTQYTEEQKNKNKPLVPPGDISPKVSEEIKAAATAPSTDAKVAFDSARQAHSEHGQGDVPSK
ncbi:hypothetical protein A1Q1_04500 [Trichosporon asahii var. asahii CBS 2479]|nr:hypothetical protein A1Q1_04500 [Trichosporon asahii var. asahii CBS 2479]EJT46757.1 hypothetical protein A1Q1_04500 [Trichosporon asahii var. asahii CBS 2479]